jgi:hypothetical protein
MNGNFFAELKRRKVFKVGAAYLVVAWLAVQAASIGFPAFDAPPWALRIFIPVALLGFPIAVVMAWVFDLTADGVKLVAETSGSKRLFAAARQPRKERPKSYLSKRMLSSALIFCLISRQFRLRSDTRRRPLTCCGVYFQFPPAKSLPSRG